jgi:hypothetical protein
MSSVMAGLLSSSQHKLPVGILQDFNFYPSEFFLTLLSIFELCFPVLLQNIDYIIVF